ncbi:BTAD domain-containing putative transcriptional regulator [Nocardiopsis sp. YSL2]|uniref:AfsR/SARP family transcriptional regulator n=1 Tax=Nocardiopsis sp. YSL2 TaxID=2939492 RepID=UPI0026F47254|nr:BTAD domain-containing putative transcriptional regulator [Nocardiopsis sp. YSL2]
MLGVLLVHVGQEVTVDRLISYLWSDDPPRTARSVIQVQVSHLRRAFPDLILTTPGGYRADFDPSAVDLHRFRALCEAAAAASGDKSLELWDQALECWRGIPFSGVGSDHLQYTIVQPLLEERWAAVTSWATCALDLGRTAEVVARLTPMSRAEPLREGLHHLLIAALWRAGERATALTVYEALRIRLADELGVSPSRDLRELHERILRSDTQEPDASADDPGVREVGSRGWSFVVRNDLPRDIPDFAGRHASIERLLKLGTSEQDGPGVCVITGSGGTGKTTLAVRVGHMLAPHYPDGQLFIDLHGYTTDAEPLDAVTALGVLLRAVGVPPDAVPDSLDERSALWRATLRERRLLAVFDNALSSARVSPLLPSSPESMVLITSRNDLAGLGGVRYLPLSMFSEDSAIDFFTLVLGEERLEGELSDALEVVRICGGMPLALRVVAGRMLSRPRWTFSHVVRRLREDRRRLRELQVDGHSVEAVIDLSYETLTSDQRSVFLLLGSAVGTTLDLRGASALLDMSLEDADDMLQELVSVCLIEEPRGDVYRFHDLVREFALYRGQSDLRAGVVADARLRQAEYYMVTAQRAADLLGPRAHDEPASAEHSRYDQELTSRVEAENWFDIHQDNIADVVDFYAAQGNGEEAWRMADAVWRFYALRGKMGLLLSSHEKALTISRNQGNDRGSAVTLIGMGIAHHITGRFDAALDLLTEAHTILHRIGDRRGMIRALANQGMVFERLGRFADSAECIEGVLDQAVALRDQRLEVLQLGNLAVLYRILGRHDEALRLGRRVVSEAVTKGMEGVRVQAVTVVGEASTVLGDLKGAFQALAQALELARAHALHSKEIYVLNSLGVAQRAAGRIDEAVDSHTAALALAEKSGDHSGDAEVITDLGLTYAAAGRFEEAVGVLEKAHAVSVERNERYIAARSALALGRIPAPAVAPARARELLADAEAAFTDLGLPEAETARTALAELSDPID